MNQPVIITGELSSIVEMADDGFKSDSTVAEHSGSLHKFPDYVINGLTCAQGADAYKEVSFVAGFLWRGRCSSYCECNIHGFWGEARGPLELEEVCRVFLSFLLTSLLADL